MATKKELEETIGCLKKMVHEMHQEADIAITLCSICTSPMKYGGDCRVCTLLDEVDSLQRRWNDDT